MAERLKEACAPRRLPVVAIGEPEPALELLGFDLTLPAPLHPAQAAMRLETLVRTAVAEEEFELRVESFAERGRTLSVPEPDGGDYQVLAIGDPAPQFLALSNALARQGARITGAFTSGGSTPWCCGRATTRRRRCRSPPACGATPASTTPPPCSTCARIPT
jgi:two-component system cell cycle response regulator PopA